MSKYPRKEVGKDVKVPAVAWDSTLEEWRDLLSDQVYNDRMGTLELQPYQTAWLAG